MSEANKAIVGRWFTEFWGNPWNAAVVAFVALDALLGVSVRIGPPSRKRRAPG